MEAIINPINYREINLGKYLKRLIYLNILFLISSKKRFEWVFELDNVKHIIAFEFSYLSGKRVVFHN